MNAVSAPQTSCRAGIARGDISPPPGIYHRMWGAAAHDRATGVHRPLTATLLWLEPATGDPSQALVIASLDHCLLDAADIEQQQQAIAIATGIQKAQIQIALTHTHAAGLMSRSRAELPGGDLIGPYLDGLAEQLGSLARAAREQRQPATIIYGTGHCNLATNRDFFDEERRQFVCGYNPVGPADATLLVARVTAADGQPLAAIVNYACHPTTLAWQNTLVSPDYLGGLREVVERQVGAPCLFLQGASADLGPREGFVGDTTVADRNGRQLGFAVLATLETLPPPDMCFVYAGPVVSGATLGTWRYEPQHRSESAAWRLTNFTVELPYRPELPTLAMTESELSRCQASVAAATDAVQARDCRARAEQLTRQLWKLRALPPGGVFPLQVAAARLGDAVWVFVPGEHYQTLQTSLRSRFPALTLIVATIAGGWQPGYIPPAATYGRGIYQEQIAVVAMGSAETLLATIGEKIERLMDL